MNQKNENCTDKNTLLDINVSNVFVVKHAKQRAFIEQFNYRSVSFTQKNLGNILGFFIVRDTSSGSENIVNFLASEVKKKYFIPNQKSVEEKFELTLHHINRILEEIANIGNIGWLGTIDGAVCVVDDTSMYFSVTGNAHILLLRDNTLIDISKDLASEESHHQPLKTFVDISSGDICADDKIIITSNELFDLISLKELQKNAIRFGHKNFIQFIETALTNECDIATTTIIDIAQENKPQTCTQKKPSITTTTNAFGSDAFDTLENDVATDMTSLDAEDLLKEPTQEEYTDPRTGHIHIQGSNEPIEEFTFIKTLRDTASDKFKSIKKNVLHFFKSTSKKSYEVDSNKNLDTEAEAEPAIINEQSTGDDFTDLGHTSTDDESSHEISDDNIYIKTKTVAYKICAITKDVAKNTTIQCVTIITNLKNKPKKTFAKIMPIDVTSKPKLSKTTSAPKKSLLPSVHHITKLWHTMNTKSKLIALGILVFMIITPIIFSLFQSSTNDDTKNTPSTDITPEEIMKPENTPNPQPSEIQNTLTTPTTLLDDSAITSTLSINNRLAGISKNKIILFNGDEKNSYPIPSDAGDIHLATPMTDLDLIFLLTSKNKLYSFSPITTKFIEQKNIQDLDVTKINFLSSYLTYIYTTTDKMITRYARQDNGFANGTDWLTKNEDLSSASSLAIDDNIYMTLNDRVTKFTNRKKEPFTQDSTIKNATFIYTTPKTNNMWILDAKNGILYKTHKETGKKVQEFTHNEFTKATSFTIDEKTNVVTVSTTDKILLFAL